MAVTPRPELEPFFKLSYECHTKDITGDPGGRALASEVQIACSVEILYPNIKEIAASTRKLSISQQAQTRKNLSKKSLRHLAKEYGVSREAIRRTINKQSA